MYRARMEYDINLGLWEWAVDGVARGGASTKRGAKRQIARTIKKHRKATTLKMVLSHTDTAKKVFNKSKWKEVK